MRSTGGRCIVVVTLAMALVLSACSQSVTVGTGIEGFEPAAEEAEAAAVELASGRDAITLAAANGEPHILWFWGAN